tara:strand:- start:560 stop:1198 length:639 start_codon:yes stop_codon:yes gene_type:complete
MDKEQERKNQNNVEPTVEEDSKSNPNSENIEKDTKKEEKELKLTPEDQINELEDKLARTFAEMENQRRRFEKEKEDAFDYGGFLFAKEALAIIDNLERSKQVLENDEKLKNSEALKKTLDHLKIISTDLISVFQKNNIQPIECMNKKLDPNFHQAMMEIENDQKEPGTIIQEIQKGFTIKNRLLRPSLVGVSKKTEKTVEKNQQNEQNLDDK